MRLGGILEYENSPKSEVDQKGSKITSICESNTCVCMRKFSNQGGIQKYENSLKSEPRKNNQKFQYMCMYEKIFKSGGNSVV